ncbi:hemicentin-2-like [Ostrea edulis]|uniref:hemicentin-2-like n=1 Tax=Ostrea edulis TaxID=37623 RepID=UPI0024AFA844|nr:hemicentin-2-like [Ostrea edulis]
MKNKFFVSNPDKPTTSVTPSGPYQIREGDTAVISCVVTDANPNTGITWSWTKTGNPAVLHTGQNYTIPNIQKGQRGTYQCTATNYIGTSLPVTVQVDVQYKPTISVTPSGPYQIREGDTAVIYCVVTDANPNTGITWSWTKTGNPAVSHTSQNNTIPNIQKGQRGTYQCTATNSIGTSLPVTVQVDVQYKPIVHLNSSNPYHVTEHRDAVMICSVIDANPSTGITWTWKKTSNSVILSREATYTIHRITRDKAGNYSCAANNSIGTSNPVTVQVDVQYGPDDVRFTPDITTINKTENQTVNPINCSAVCNPACTYNWTGVSTINSGKLDLGVLKRDEKGTYSCSAGNSITSTSKDLIVIVNYPPNFQLFQASGQNSENLSFSLTCNVDSYPLSTIKIQNAETGEVIASNSEQDSLVFSETSAKCYQTANYTCIAENYFTAILSPKQRISINCKPRTSDGKSSMKIGIKTHEGLNISTDFIGYPLPKVSWTFKRNSTNNGILIPNANITVLQLNVSAVRTAYVKSTLTEEEFGSYIVTADSSAGSSEFIFEVIPERKPDSPHSISVNCKLAPGTAVLRWSPSFNGGAPQQFIVSYESTQGHQINSSVFSNPNGTIEGLQGGMQYSFQVIAFNDNGETYSEEEEECITQVNGDTTDNLPLIAGGAVGGILFAVLVVIGILFILRRVRQSEGDKKDLHLSKAKLNEREDTDEDDGLKDNILYESAGPRDEEPETSGSAVYAEVNKKKPFSDNNSNIFVGQKPKEEGALYADVVKPKKGLFKKDDKAKQKKGKKPKEKKKIPDVYENSEDIAMTQKNNSDNVYSNAAEGNNLRNGSRGYKNQDGLLYVEVQFDQNKEKGKPVIHGEDEKTDYATVEFPYPKPNSADMSGEGKI